MRPGERMHESLFSSEEPTTDVGLAGVLSSRAPHPGMHQMQRILAHLAEAIARDDRAALAEMVSPAAWADLPGAPEADPGVLRRSA